MNTSQQLTSTRHDIQVLRNGNTQAEDDKIIEALKLDNFFPIGDVETLLKFDSYLIESRNFHDQIVNF